MLAKWALRTRRTWVRGTTSGTAQQFVLLGLRAAVIGLVIWLWANGQATPGDVAFVLTSYAVVHGYLRDVGQHVHNLQRSVNDMEELVAMHAQPYGVPDRKGATAMVVTAGEIAFEHVTFHYGGHAEPLYRDFSLTIAAGEKVGLVGRSGSGKTTFVKLVQRLYDVTGGRIAIDGQRHRRGDAGVACARRSRSCSRSRCCSTARWRRTSPMAGRAPRWPRSSRRRSSPTRMSSSCACRRATPRWSASAASSSRAASASASRWRGPSWPMRRS